MHRKSRPLRTSRFQNPKVKSAPSLASRDTIGDSYRATLRPLVVALTDITCKEVPNRVAWTPECQRAFATLYTTSVMFSGGSPKPRFQPPIHPTDRCVQPWRGDRAQPARR